MPARTYPWRQAFHSALYWLVGCPVAGFIAASFNGEHGSIIFLAYAIWIAFAGALSHIVMLAFSSFRSLKWTHKSLALGVSNTIILLAFAVIEASTENSSDAFAYKNALTFVLEFAVIPAFLAAIAIVWVTDNAA